MTNWALKPVPEMPPELTSGRLNPVTLKLLMQRGFFSFQEIEKFLHTRYEDLRSPFDLKGMDEAVETIKKAKELEKPITIYGDYDADGITSTIILKEALEALGLTPTTYIPDRNKEGYGLNKDALDFIKKEYKTELLITVDCGISNAIEIKYAKKLGMEVLVTDHHSVPKKLPQGCILINPKLPKQKYEFSDLAGVGVAFQFARALWQKLLPNKLDQLKWFLDLVAIGTVADCVPLVDENRIFTKFGLIVLQKTKRIGIQELMKTARLLVDEKNPPTAVNIAFHIGPRFNAAGRMDHADLTLNLLSENDRVKARILSLELESKNSSRQKITQEIYEEVKSTLSESQNYHLIIKKGKNWPLGILGVVAGKIADEYNCPTFILREPDDNELLEGSARSIDHFDLIAAVSQIDNLLERYGGHAQAMGIKIKAKNLANFEKKLLELVDLAYNKDIGGNRIQADAMLEPDEIDWDLVSEIRKLEPYGEGNWEPVFVTKNFILESVDKVGNGKKHLKFKLSAKNLKNKILDAIYFKGAELAGDLRSGDKITAIYNLRSSEWNGNHKLELNLIALEKQR